jgi:hypothetical protein
MNAGEVELERMMREIVRSKKWKAMAKTMKLGRMPRILGVRLERIPPEWNGQIPVARATILPPGAWEIYFQEYYVGAMSRRLVKAVMTHELAHIYCSAHSFEAAKTNTDSHGGVFAEVMSHLGGAVELKLVMHWRRAGEKDWRGN